MTGLCTGSLSAVAASCATSPAELSWLGLLTVKVAFRVGACAWDMGTRLSVLQDAAGKYRSWTAAIAGTTADELVEIIKRYSKEKVCLTKQKGGKERKRAKAD